MIRLKILNESKKIELKCNFKFPNISKGILQEKEVTPTKETQEIEASAGYTALSKVIVDKIPDEYIIPSGDIEINQNGTYDIKEKQYANVNIPEKQLGTKLITENGTYKASDDNLDGYSQVEVTTSGVDINDYYDFTKKNSATTATKYIKKFPNIDISHYQDMQFMFDGFQYLLESPELDTRNIQLMGYAFRNCYKLITTPQLNAQKVKDLSDCFRNCYKLTNFGGLLDLGENYSMTVSANQSGYRLVLSDSSKLTHDSLMNVINKVYDIATKGVTTQQIVLGSTNITKLTAEEIAIATNKGWSVS